METMTSEKVVWVSILTQEDEETGQFRYTVSDSGGALPEAVLDTADQVQKNCEYREEYYRALGYKVEGREAY